MKVLLVNGSPHKSGCTFTALNIVAKALNEEDIDTEIMYLGNQPIAGCIGCGRCQETGLCFRNDVVNDFAAKSKEFDGFIFGTPVHYASACGAITSFLDRVFCVPEADLTNKPGASVISCRRAGATAAFDMVNKYMTIRCMPVVSSNYWNHVHGNTPEEVMKDEEGVQTMRVLGKNMAWLLKCIDSAKKAGINPPTQESKIKTNFIR